MINEPTGETYAVGIVTSPVGCEPVFGRLPATLRGRVIDLEVAWPSAGALRDELARLLRLRSLLAELDVSAEVRWVDHAYRLGWSDQSHFVRDFKRYTGLTPSAYLAAQRSAFSPGELEHSSGFAPGG